MAYTSARSGIDRHYGCGWMQRWGGSVEAIRTRLRIEDICEEAERVKKNPTSLNPFLRYTLNVWTSSEKG
jgi:hypothetical protein